MKNLLNKKQIELEIRKAINRHLVNHVDVPKGDNRCRIDILCEEAATNIINNIENNGTNDNNQAT